MSTDGGPTTSGEQTRLIGQLQNLLEKQLQLARQGDATSERFGALMGKAGSLLEEMARTGIADLADVQRHREELRRRYESVCLIVAAQKAHVSRELRQIRRGRNILGTYRRNIRP
ncbi:MAG: hypothetical protein A2Z25_15825 [Planctomycetes bacterium RBG_16_55_9]|nr:MAG: hypothetical protein A2Z25_15825 [Planctomycetes bacterium RBG_16_55_9]